MLLKMTNATQWRATVKHWRWSPLSNCHCLTWLNLLSSRIRRWYPTGPKVHRYRQGSYKYVGRNAPRRRTASLALICSTSPTDAYTQSDGSLASLEQSWRVRELVRMGFDTPTIFHSFTHYFVLFFLYYYYYFFVLPIIIYALPAPYKSRDAICWSCLVNTAPFINCLAGQWGL